MKKQRQILSILLGSAVLLFVTVGCGDESNPQEPEPQSIFPQGTFITTMTVADLPTGLPEPLLQELLGRWDLTFGDQNDVFVIKGGVVVADGRYTTDQNQLVITDEKGPLACLVEGWETGTYEWTFASNLLTLTVIDDQCDGRPLVLTALPWTKQT